MVGIPFIHSTNTFILILNTVRCSVVGICGSNSQMINRIILECFYRLSELTGMLLILISIKITTNCVSVAQSTHSHHSNSANYEIIS